MSSDNIKSALMDMKVKDLKQCLTMLGLKKTGVKQELYLRILAIFEPEKFPHLAPFNVTTNDRNRAVNVINEVARAAGNRFAAPPPSRVPQGGAGGSAGVSRAGMTGSANEEVRCLCGTQRSAGMCAEMI